MQLIYRGIRYNLTNPNTAKVDLTPSNSSVQLTYRGAGYTLSNYDAMADAASIQPAICLRDSVLSEHASHPDISFNYKLRFLGATYNKTVFG